MSKHRNLQLSVVHCCEGVLMSQALPIVLWLQGTHKLACADFETLLVPQEPVPLWANQCGSVPQSAPAAPSIHSLFSQSTPFSQ